MRARLRYHFKIELVDPTVIDPYRGSPIRGKARLVGRLLAPRLTGLARVMTTDRLPAKGPQARLLTVTERESGDVVLLGAVDVGDEGQEIVAALHRAWKLDEEEPFLELAKELLSNHPAS